MRRHAPWPLAFVLAQASSLAVAADCSSKTGYIISSPSDAKGISSCSTFEGSVSLQFADDPSAWSSEAEADLGGLTTILGNLTIYPDARHEKTRVKAPKLEQVSGGITIWNQDSSSTIDTVEVSFPKLATVKDNYAITGGIQNIKIDESDNTQAKKLFRLWSTAAEQFSLSGLTAVDGAVEVDSNPDLEKLELGDLASIGSSLRVQTNKKLSSVKLDKLEHVKGDLRFYQNGGLDELKLPNLQSADTISITENGANPSVSFPKLTSLGSPSTSQESTFSGLGALDLPVLNDVNGGLGFRSTNLEELVLPALKSINGSITTKDNGQLTALALPRLQTLGDIFIESNSKLSNFTANALSTAGTISIKGGGLVNVELFGLTKVRGDFKVSGADSMDCTWFEEHIRPVVTGIFSCQGSHEKPSQERKPSTGGIENTPVPTEGTGSNTSKPSGSGSSGMSTGAKAGIGAGIALIAVLGGLLAFFLWRRKRQARQGQEKLQDSEEPSKMDPDTSSAEVYDGVVPVKMGVETTIQSLAPKEKRQSFLNFRMSAGQLGLQTSPGAGTS